MPLHLHLYNHKAPHNNTVNIPSKRKMVCLQSTLLLSIYQAFVPNASPPQLALSKNGSSSNKASVSVKAQQESSEHPVIPSQVSRRLLLAVGGSIPSVLSFNHAPLSFAAESKKGFLPVMDNKDGYSFFYPFGWQEVIIEGQDKVFKDVIEPLESVSVSMIPTSKQDIKDFGPPQEVAETLIKKVLAPPNQKTKLIQAKELDVDGKTYYTFEFISQARNYTRHALSTICIGNGKFYTLTTGANERRWDKMKDRLYNVIDSFRVFNV